jgi:hypothetical protein
MTFRRSSILFVKTFVVQSYDAWGDMMGTKRPPPMPTKQLEDLLKAHALRRLEGHLFGAPERAKIKRAKTKRASKQKKR